MSNIEFGNNLTEGTSVKSEKERPSTEPWGTPKRRFYCVNTSYPMDNLLNRSAQTGPPNVRKRHPVFPSAGWSVVLVHSPDGVSYFLPV